MKPGKLSQQKVIFFIEQVDKIKNAMSKLSLPVPEWAKRYNINYK